MFLNHPIRNYFPHAIAAAVAYTIPAWLYIYRAHFADSWLLYIGNFLFGIVILLFVFAFYRRNPKTRSISKMVIAAHITSFISIILICILGVIGLALFSPEVFGRDRPELDQLVAEPSQIQGDPNEGLVMIFFINAIVGNAGTGFLIALLFPFALMRNQKGNKEGENLGPGKQVGKLKRTVVDSLDQPVRRGSKP
jgi:hypothetical protein